MQKIVLTGNIGAGKSTIIKIFQRYHVPLFDSDACVTEIYNNNIPFKDALYKINPEFIVDNAISKKMIIDYLQKNSDFMDTLEGLLYPLLAVKRQEFIDTHTQHNQKMVVFEVPLLFEKKLASLYDVIILVYAPYEIRLMRALQRPNMNIEKFHLINKRQIDYTDLYHHVDLAIDTSQPFEKCEQQIINRFFKES
jgi:dephospho-CoA kinase